MLSNVKRSQLRPVRCAAYPTPTEKTTHTIAKAKNDISVHSLSPPIVFPDMNSIIYLQPCTIFHTIETLAAKDVKISHLKIPFSQS